MDKLVATSSFQAGVTVKTVVKEDNTIEIELSGPALDPILQLADMTSIKFNSDFTDCRNLAADLQTAASRSMRP